MHVCKIFKHRNTPLFQKASKKAPTKITRKHKTVIYATQHVFYVQVKLSSAMVIPSLHRTAEQLSHIIIGKLTLVKEN